MIRARGVRVRRGAREVLRGVDLDARAGEVTSVLGPNGAGKSTLLRALAGLLPCEGEIEVGGAALLGLSPRARAQTIAYVPQRTQLQSALPVAAVVAQGRYAHTGGLGRPGGADRRAIASALARTGLEALADRAFDRLSTGEQRRVLLARALATGAPTLLLDEPTEALDVGHSLALHALLRSLAEDGRTVVAVLHGLDDARRHTDRAILLQDGAVVAAGPSDEVVSAAPVREVYGVTLREREGLAFALAPEDDG